MRRTALALAALTLVAALFALAPHSAGAEDNGGNRVDDDAGASPSALPPAPAPGPGVETTSSVGNEVQYRAALAALSLDPAGPHTIEITASFTVDDGFDPVYGNSTEDLTINGNGFTVTSAGGDDQRFLDVDEDVDLTINDLTVVGFESQGSGGAINADGAVDVFGSTFRGNRADGDGGAIDVDETSTVNGSTFEDNHAEDGDGGALDTSNDDTDVTAVDSTFRGNTAEFQGGALSAQADIFSTRSTFVGNESEEGAAVGAFGSVSMTNSTVTGNVGDFDIIDGTGDETGIGDVTLIHVTIADNTVLDDEGVIDSDEDGVLTAFATTISGTQGLGTNCETGDFSSVVSSFTRSDDASCGFTGTGDVEGAGDPGLGALAQNGGATETMLPETGSPLVDGVPEGDCDPTILDDQRNVSRPQDGDGDGVTGCDIGSVEVEGEVVEPPPEPGPVPATPPFTG